MTLFGPHRLVPLSALLVVQGASAVVALETLSRQSVSTAGYVPWLIGFGSLLAVALILLQPRPVPSTLVLLIWAFSVQLILLPPGFSVAFRVLAMVPLLIQTVLTLPNVPGLVLGALELVFFVTGQGT